MTTTALPKQFNVLWLLLVLAAPLLWFGWTRATRDPIVTPEQRAAHAASIEASRHPATVLICDGKVMDKRQAVRGAADGMKCSLHLATDTLPQ